MENRRLTARELAEDVGKTTGSVDAILSETFAKIVTQAPYSPDMSPCDFFLLIRLKKPWKSQKVKMCFQDWIKRWCTCMCTATKRGLLGRRQNKFG